jgi:hypothetical protein
MIPPPTIVNDEHKQYGIAIGIIVLSAIATVVTGLRLWYRASRQTFGADDIAIVPALVSRATSVAVLCSDSSSSCT